MGEILCATGCWQCGENCPWTDETTPKLTPKLADEWFQTHRRECPIPDWPGAEQQEATT